MLTISKAVLPFGKPGLVSFPRRIPNLRHPQTLATSDDNVMTPQTFLRVPYEERERRSVEAKVAAHPAWPPSLSLRSWPMLGLSPPSDGC